MFCQLSAPVARDLWPPFWPGGKGDPLGRAGTVYRSNRHRFGAGATCVDAGERRGLGHAAGKYLIDAALKRVRRLR